MSNVVELLQQDDRPTISQEGDGDLPKVVDDVEYQIGKVQAPVLFQRGGILVRVVVGDEGHKSTIRRDEQAPRIVRHDIVSMQDTISRHFQMRKRNRKTGKF
jgi:hypothetical protein